LFRGKGISYNISKKSKSEIYIDLLPMLNSGRVALLDHPKMVAQLCGLERRTTRGTGRPESKKGMTMVETVDRGPYMKIMDRMALARQAQTGESYAAAFTKVYEAPENAAIRDGARLDHPVESPRRDSWDGTVTYPEGRESGAP
jgi:hypothetical protein